MPGGLGKKGFAANIDVDPGENEEVEKRAKSSEGTGGLRRKYGPCPAFLFPWRCNHERFGPVKSAWPRAEKAGKDLT